MFTFSNNTPTIVKNRCRLDVRCHFFCERVTDRRNSLDQRVIDSATVNAFMNGLEKNKKYIDRLLYGLTVRQAVGLTYSGFSGSGAAAPGM